MKRRLAFLAALALTLPGCGYNQIQTLDEAAEQQLSNIDTELQRRNDLIPNLVKTVDEAASFEQETQTGVAEARAGVTAARGSLTQAQQKMADALKNGEATPDQISAADAEVQSTMRNFINISVEAYPQLRSNENFLRLQDELTETENRISVARRDYNEAVTTYNTYIRRFPAALTAKVTGAKQREQFKAPESAKGAPTVDFQRGDSGR
jgi:LemA protein